MRRRDDRKMSNWNRFRCCGANNRPQHFPPFTIASHWIWNWISSGFSTIPILPHTHKHATVVDVQMNSSLLCRTMNYDAVKSLYGPKSIHTLQVRCEQRMFSSHAKIYLSMRATHDPHVLPWLRANSQFASKTNIEMNEWTSIAETFRQGHSPDMHRSMACIRSSTTWHILLACFLLSRLRHHHCCCFMSFAIWFFCEICRR